MSEEKKPQFSIQRLYVKDLSLESPNAPEVFQKEWKPELNVDIDTTHRHLQEDFYEASVKINVQVKSNEWVAFVCEIEQAGIFTVMNFSDQQREHLLESICPEIIFPFAREAISDVVSKAGFPQLLLAPINFEAFYQEKKAKKA
jgi:preprotein translocase subunit SecB